MKLWAIAPFNRDEANDIQSKYELPAIIAMLLQIRNIKTREEIVDFLQNDSEIASPFTIKDMDKACARVTAAIESGELICVYGDYDADGVTSTALLYSYLDAVGANAMYYIPSREAEGYGMNIAAVDLIGRDEIPEELPKGVLSDQLSLFEQPELYTADEQQRRDREAAEEAADEKERRLQEATLKMQAKYGKNAVLRGVSYREGATGRDRNKQIGGHRSGEEDDF